MIDSHCHLDVSLFDPDRSDALARAASRGVTHIVIPAVDEASWSTITTLSKNLPSPIGGGAGGGGGPTCHAALGLHPVALPSMPPADDARVLSALKSAAIRDRPVAIGECGLDTTIDLEKAPLARQEAILDAHLALARELDLPLILHARGPHCYERLYAFLAARELPRRGGVLHSYAGGIDLLKKYLTLPLLFGFAGPATYPNARKVRTSIEAVPDDRLLAETDAPDQTPEPHRPGRSEPAYVADVIDGLAAARKADPQAIAALTTANARRLFDLP